MANKNNNEAVNSTAKNYAKIGIIAAIVVVIGVVGVFSSIKYFKRTTPSVTVEEAMSEVSTDAANGAQMRIAVIRMDAVQNDAKALQDLRKQKEKYENKLRDELTSQQKTLEKEKTEIEKSQDVLAPDALQRRIANYQNNVAKLQRSLAERAQSIDMAYQKALADIQAKLLDPIIDATIAKKKLSLVLDSRFARVSPDVKNLDITDEVTAALNKKVSSVKMDKPQGF